MELPVAKDAAKNRFCFDFNLALGVNLAQKAQCLYVALSRMKDIAERDCERPLDILICSPMVFYILEITENIHPAQKDQQILVSPLKIRGKAWNKWLTLVDHDTYDEHHLIMTRLIDDKFPADPKYYVRFSISNLLMSNMFGYYNL
jgi:hypothetical protein